MDPLEVFRCYMAVYLHFNSPYDIFVNNARAPNITQERLNAQSARKALIMRLSKQYTNAPRLISFFASQYAYSLSNVAYDDMTAQHNFEKWNSFRASSTYQIIDELQDHNLKAITDGLTPTIFNMIASGEVDICTATALNNLMPYIRKDYFIFKTMSSTIEKLAKFIHFDTTQVTRELNLS